MAILISDKIDFKIKNIIRVKEVHYILIKGSIQEDDITIVNVYAPNIGTPQYIRQTLTNIRGETDSNTIIVGDFNAPLSPTDSSSKHRIKKEAQTLNETLDQMNLIYILRNFHPNAEYTFFSSAQETFSKIDHNLSLESNLSKFKKIEIISSILSDHNVMILDINYWKHTHTHTHTHNSWRLSNTSLRNKEVTEEIRK